MIEALQAIYDFLAIGIYEFIQEVFAELIIWVVTWYFKLKFAALTFSWAVASSALDSLNLSTLITQYWGDIDSDLLAFCSRYSIPEAINMVINAFITRFIWRLL